MAIRTAKSVVEEVPEVAQSSVGTLARCHEDHSERDAHRVSKRFGLTLPLPLTDILVGGETVPFIKMTHWAEFLLQHSLWHRLCGLDHPDEKRTGEIWTSFWNRYKKINPGHEIFTRRGHDFSRTCGLMLHGDEGRSLRKSPIMVISTHSVMGFGISTSCPKYKDGYLAQKLNYEKSTWTTRFLLSVLPKHYYNEDDEDWESDPFQDLMLGISMDLRKLYDDGIQTKDGRFFFCILNVMGDWPFIQKCGALGRSYLNISKASSSKTASKGICHLCKADMAGVVWEDFDQQPPSWYPTVNTLDAFLKRPAVLLLPHDRSFPESYFSFDLFHAWHLGAGKTFLASCLAALSMSSAYDGGIDLRLENVSSDFTEWTQATGYRCQLRKINKAKLGWAAQTTFPAGTWSKGGTTTCLMRFFLAMCKKYSEHIDGDILLQLVHLAAKRIDYFLRSLYSCELWISSERAAKIASSGHDFLKLYGKVVQVAHSRGQLLFQLMPNFHRIHHLIDDMQTQSRESDWVLKWY